MSRTRKRQPREIEQKLNRDQRRQQRELLDRYMRRKNYPSPENEFSYRE